MLNRIQELNHQIRLCEGDNLHRDVRQLIKDLQRSPGSPGCMSIVLTAEESPRMYADLTRRKFRKANISEDRHSDYSQSWPIAPYTIKETCEDYVRK